MIALAAGAALGAWAFTALYLAFGRRVQHLDEPNARSAHIRPTPSSGGVAIIAAVLLALAAGELLETISLPARERWALLIAALFCLVGLVDDRRSLSVRVRLPLFLGLALLAARLYLPAGTGWLLVGAAALAITWQVNLFNFMDGIDGIAALQGVLVSIVMTVVAFYGDAPAAFGACALSLAGAFAAFLVFNWPPARIFMGDAGSLSGGYALGWLGLWGAVDGFLPPLVWLLLMSPFLLDTAVTLLRRLLRGERIFEAHNQHLYQRLARHYRSHQRVDLGLLALHGLWLAPLSLAHVAGAVSGPLAAALALFPQLLLMAKASTFK